MKEKCFSNKCYGYHYIQPTEVGFLEVCNDRVRQAEDKGLADNVEMKFDAVNKEVARKLDKMQEDITAIKVAIARR